MSKKSFIEKQIKQLAINPYVKAVSSKRKKMPPVKYSDHLLEVA